MALKRKQPPATLDNNIVEWAWPEDDAVDVEKSDLVAYCRDGGQSGLSIGDDSDPSIIKVGPLSDKEFKHVLMLMGSGDPCFAEEAFRYGVINIEGFPRRFATMGSVTGLAENILDELCEFRMELPRLVAERKCWEANGQEFEEAVSEEMVETSLPQLIGYHILAATFRQRQRDA